MTDCIYCKIIKGELPSTKIYEDSDYVVIKDIHPQAPIHWLAMPKKHLESIHLVKDPADKELVKGLLDVIRKVIDQEGLDGLQLHINSGKNHNQLVPHIHVHILNKGILGEKW